MRIDIVSIFPEYLQPLRLSLVGKAIEAGIVELGVHDLRQWTHDRHRRTDDTPYGGGAGMVMRPEPWGEALDALAGPDSTLLIMTPAGRRLDQPLAHRLAGRPHLIMACGRYEGIDARVAAYARTRLEVEEISIGDYVLSGGEAAALVVTEAVVRLLTGVIGNPASLAEESHSGGQHGLLEYPVYTKPPQWRGFAVPEILFSGHHAQIAAWRRARAVELTRERRPDLLPAAEQPVLIEPARADQAGEIWTIEKAAYLPEGRRHGDLDIPPLTETLAQLRDAIAGHTVLVARQGPRVIGSVRGAVDGEVWTVGRLMVSPDRQGEGIGDRLLTAIERLAPAGCTRAQLVTGANSAGNLGFYARRGYREVSRSGPPGAVALVRLEKPLPAARAAGGAETAPADESGEKHQ